MLGGTGWDWDRGVFRVSGTEWDSGQVSQAVQLFGFWLWFFSRTSPLVPRWGYKGVKSSKFEGSQVHPQGGGGLGIFFFGFVYLLL